MLLILMLYKVPPNGPIAHCVHYQDANNNVCDQCEQGYHVHFDGSYCVGMYFCQYFSMSLLLILLLLLPL